ncbi:YMGG-like glycine zipper-containing protein [Pontibaca methylaminivorans]|uniref:YMGG-like glycine zipper-containing protein n=1 Tax=Pontibaca methylaminivorans TaxID=515897 RepID=UPI0009765582|nr:YMGG-like glycine zipper-containing protein [Pontibaca methylaminivorans]
MKKTVIFASALAAALSGCQKLEDYRPVTDPSAAAAPRYEADLAHCYQIGKAAEADYQKRQQQQMLAGLLVGAVGGALIGRAVDHSYTGYGAAYGAAAGATSGAASGGDLAHGGPRRIIDRCMTERGHRVLSDLGRG